MRNVTWSFPAARSLTSNKNNVRTTRSFFCAWTPHVWTRARARSHAKKVLKIRTFSLRRHRIKSFLSSFAESRMKKIFGIRTQQLLQLNLNRIMEQFLEIIREKRTFYHSRSVTVQTRLTGWLSFCTFVATFSISRRLWRTDWFVAANDTHVWF